MTPQRIHGVLRLPGAAGVGETGPLCSCDRLQQVISLGFVRTG